jgi:2-methylisocitrate lyase-like PEP mutase family enzyme
VSTPFQRLHSSGCFLLPNPWDIGSAVYLHRLGFVALATTSAGYAFSQGRPDDPAAIPLDAMLAHITDLVAATPLPVNADFQNGYADAPEDVAANVARCVATGVAGLSIEDATGDPGTPLYERELAIERIRAARAAIDATGIPVVLTARCEAALVGHPEARLVIRERLVAFADAGADCLYAPGLRTAEEVREVVAAVAPLPMNVLAGEGGPMRTVAELADLGVRRVSLGSALARAAWGGLQRAAQALADDGSFAGMTGAMPYGELSRVFTSPSS